MYFIGHNSVGGGYWTGKSHIVGWCRSILSILVKIGQLNRGFLVDHRENLHPKTPEINELDRVLSNAGLTFKIGSVLVKLQLGRVRNKMKISGTPRIFLSDFKQNHQIVFKRKVLIVSGFETLKNR